MKTSFCLILSAASVLCLHGDDGEELPIFEHTSTGIIRTLHETKLSPRQEEWVNMLEPQLRDHLFWNEQRNVAVIYTSFILPDNGGINHIWLCYRPNEKGWMTMYAIKELKSDYLKRLNNLSVFEASALVSFYDTRETKGMRSVTYGLDLEPNHAIKVIMDGKKIEESSKPFDPNIIRKKDFTPSDPQESPKS